MRLEVSLVELALVDAFAVATVAALLGRAQAIDTVPTGPDAMVLDPVLVALLPPLLKLLAFAPVVKFSSTS